MAFGMTGSLFKKGGMTASNGVPIPTSNCAKITQTKIFSGLVEIDKFWEKAIFFSWKASAAGRQAGICIASP